VAATKASAISRSIHACPLNRSARRRGEEGVELEADWRGYSAADRCCFSAAGSSPGWGVIWKRLPALSVMNLGTDLVPDGSESPGKPNLAHVSPEGKAENDFWAVPYSVRAAEKARNSGGSASSAAGKGNPVDFLAAVPYNRGRVTGRRRECLSACSISLWEE